MEKIFWWVVVLVIFFIGINIGYTTYNNSFKNYYQGATIVIQFEGSDKVYEELFYTHKGFTSPKGMYRLIESKRDSVERKELKSVKIKTIKVIRP